MTEITENDIELCVSEEFNYLGLVKLNAFQS